MWSTRATRCWRRRRSLLLWLDVRRRFFGRGVDLGVIRIRGGLLTVRLLASRLRRLLRSGLGRILGWLLLQILALRLRSRSSVLLILCLHIPPLRLDFMDILFRLLSGRQGLVRIDLLCRFVVRSTIPSVNLA